jgi:hypothetical protein
MWDAPRYFWTGLSPSAGLRLKSDSFGQSLAAYLSPSPVPIRLRTHGANKRWFVSANIRHFFDPGSGSGGRSSGVDDKKPKVWGIFCCNLLLMSVI